MLNADLPAPPSCGGDAGPLARLLAGGRHNRLLILGAPPPELGIEGTGHFERVVRLVQTDAQAEHAGHNLAVADPTRLPFVEALFDRVLLTSLLPSTAARTELREAWRIMSPAALAVFVVKARRPWQVKHAGWSTDDLVAVIEASMFEVLDKAVETIPDRHHIVLVSKRDGLRAAPLGAVMARTAPATT